MSAVTLYAKPSASFASKLAATQALLQSAVRDFNPLTQASCLGVEDMVVSHLLHTLDLPVEIFVLQTGKLHSQTLHMIDAVQTNFTSPRRKLKIYEPDALQAMQFVANNGAMAMRNSMALRKACCDIRKMQPLAKALAGKGGWITGLRREQSDARAEVPGIEMQSVLESGVTKQRAKVNPLADWTLGDIWHYIAVNAVPYNPLHDQFYPSIGCEPCTRAVSVGEDFRSGRWWWESSAAKECGLHVSASLSTV